MRLTPFEITAIKQSANTIFGDAAKVYLFGSRVDDSKKAATSIYTLRLKIKIICTRKKSSF